MCGRRLIQRAVSLKYFMLLDFVNTSAASARDPMALKLSVENLAFVKLCENQRRKGQKLLA